MKSRLLWYSSAITLVLLLAGCETSAPTQSGESEVPFAVKTDTTSAGKSSKKPKDGAGNTTDALPPNLFRAGPVWQLDHYEPISGRLVGYWPGSGTFDAGTMRTKYGFKGVLVDAAGDPAAYQRYINAGYSTSNMMIPVGITNWDYVISNYPAGYYYVGEPVKHDCLVQWSSPWGGYLNLFPQIRTRCQPSKLVVDGYMPCPHFAGVVNDADIVMYSSYHMYHSYGNNECWSDWVTDQYENGLCNDQRDMWTSFKMWWPTKFTQAWIGGHQCTDREPNNGCLHGDGNEEIPNLCGHANNLGLTNLWLFCGCGTEASRIENFCYFAWVNHYLRRFETQVYTWYRCTSPSGCHEDPPSSGWQFMYYTYGSSREVIAQ